MVGRFETMLRDGHEYARTSLARAPTFVATVAVTLKGRCLDCGERSVVCTVGVAGEVCVSQSPGKAR